MNDESLAQHIETTATGIPLERRITQLENASSDLGSELLGLQLELAEMKDLARHTWRRVWIAVALAGLAFGTAIGEAIFGIMR